MTASVEAVRTNSACRLCRQRNVVDSTMIGSTTVERPMFVTFYCHPCAQRLISMACKASDQIRSAFMKNGMLLKIMMNKGTEALRVRVPHIPCPDNDVFRTYWPKTEDECKAWTEWRSDEVKKLGET